MSKNQIIGGQLVNVEGMTVKGLRHMLSHDFKVKGLSALRKAELVRIAKHFFVSEVHVVKEVTVSGEEVTRFVPKFDEYKKEQETMKIKTTKQAFAKLSAQPHGKNIVAEVSAAMSAGNKLDAIVKAPENFIKTEHIPYVKDFASKYNVAFVTAPTREMGLVFVADLLTAESKLIEGAVQTVVKPRLELRAENAVMSTLSTNYVMVTRSEETGEMYTLSKEQAAHVVKFGQLKKDLSYDFEGVNYKRVRDLRYIMSMDYNLPILEGQKKLTAQQKLLQHSAVMNGVFFDFNGTMLKAEYFLASASEKRTVMGTHIVGKDAVEALHVLGMDMRQFAKYDGVKYTLDMTKAPTRFGLASTSTVPSTLVKIGNKVKEYENGDYALLGGTHTMKVTNDIYSYVKQGEYLAFDAANDKFIKLAASEVPFKRNVTDGLIFADASVQFALNAEFGKLISAEQVRITPATKGLVVFVPGLKEMVGHDLLAFESAVKGSYKTLLRTNPDFQVEFRIAIFGKDASHDKKKTNIPYQMIQTLFNQEHLDALKDKLDVELEEAFKVYDDPNKLSEYLGTKTLDMYEDMADEDITEEQREHIEGTLVSMFTNFFYAGSFVMEDLYFKKRLLDIIENMIKAWTRGALPVDGHYRFMVTDVYGVMEAYRQGSRDIKFKRTTDFVEYDEKGNADIIVPSHVGIPANHVVMVDDEDKFFADNKEIVFQRNPKISMKETAKATGIITEDYFFARKEYPFAFNNLVFFSCHDFHVVKQGGADFDGDKTHASMDPVLVNAVKELPALLDLTLIDGEFIEGCPWQPDVKSEAEYTFVNDQGHIVTQVCEYNVFDTEGTQANKGFKASFTDADYTPEFARQLHELSKVFVLRSLEPNRIGELTDYATKLLAAISRLEWSLSHNVTVDGEVLDADMRNMYKQEIEAMDVMVDKLRLAQGFEIDRPKHGGAFWNEMNLDFIVKPEAFPRFASSTRMVNGRPVTSYDSLEWHKAGKSMNSLTLKAGQVYPSLMQELRAHVLFQFATKVKARFNELNPALDSHNLIARFAPHANVYDHNVVEWISKQLTNIFRAYGEAQRHIMEVRKQYEAQHEMMNFASKHEAELHNRKMKFELSKLQEQAITAARSQVKALPFDAETIAYVAYAKKYREYRHDKAQTVGAGLSFPWVVCQEGMLKLVEKVSGKTNSLVKLQPIEPAEVKIRFGAFTVSNDKVARAFASSAKAGVVYEVDQTTGYYLPFVYVAGERVGVLFEDYTYYFTGAEKFVFTFKDVNVTAKSASFTLTNIVRYQG